MNRRWRHLWTVWLLALAGTLALFNLRPDLDLAVTAAVHEAAAATPFPLGQLAPVQALYHAVPWIGRLGVLLALLLWWRRATPPRTRRQAAAMALMLVFGLGLVVNGVLKEQWGRPRPTAVRDFGGPHAFQPAGRISALCRSNCSFVSGHAATGFALAALGLMGTPARRRRWAAIGLGAGLIVGAGRVMQGGHFLSDIIVAGLVMHGTGLAIRHLWLLQRGRPHRFAAEPTLFPTGTGSSVSSRPSLVHTKAALSGKTGA
ncbi:MAG: hypothetical protein RLZZ592_1423 [Pseudomonadota bacterium]|jgi:membrane-associated phospholipid phosphatase|nr:lipid 4-phosphatase [Pseudomonadota bacterium]